MYCSSPSHLSMQGSKQFKQEVLKNLLLGLRKGAGVASSRSTVMSADERKRAIRHAADAALAAARGSAPRWSRSLAAELSLPAGLGNAHLRRPVISKRTPSRCKSRCSRRRTMSLRPRPKRSKAATAKAAAGAVARDMVARRRARALREIVPGGRGMADECTLLGETLDYAVCLRAQVEAMQLLVRTLQSPCSKNPMLTQH